MFDSKYARKISDQVIRNAFDAAVRTEDFYLFESLLRHFSGKISPATENKLDDNCKGLLNDAREAEGKTKEPRLQGSSGSSSKEPSGLESIEE